MNPARILIRLTLPGLLLAAADAAAQQAIDESRSVASNERIALDVMRGEVRIRPSQDGLFRVRGTLDEEAEGYTLESAGGSTYFEVELPRSAGRWNDRGDVDMPSNLDIELPAGARLEFQGVSTLVIVTGITGSSEIHSVNGRIEASSLSGSVELSTVNGSILSTGNTGQLSLRSVNGELEDTGSSGRIDYSSVNGSIRAETAAQEVAVDTVNGDVSLSLRGTRALTLETVNGDYDIQLADSANPRIEGSSVSGDLLLRLPADLDARVALATHSGDISNGLSAAEAERDRFGPRKNLVFTLGQGEGEVELRSISGDLSLSQP